MKAFWASVIVAIGIGIAAAVILDNVGMSTANVYQGSNVRL
ncbi:MAG: hypothetical protein QGG17_08735 [Rhodospirillales bacterium]|jgi:hypothetical protein|nr:hypothetical protein [Rhodospirillales bacterium]|tara:strand:+ start:494 stop:616 length:123 start_codon:yes stop_codon:yes gene_type:complete